MSDDWPGTPEDTSSQWPGAPEQSGAPKTSALESVAQGAVSGATAGWAPELGGLRAASGTPNWVPHTMLTDPTLLGIGAARLAWEHMTGNPGPATAQYEKTKNDLAQRQGTMQQEHPWAYGGGELAGSVLPMAVAPEASGPGLAARLAQGAKIGAGYGAASGASEGFEKNGLSGALEGAGVGAGEGAIGGAGGELGGSLLGKGANLAYDYLGKPLASTVRGIINPTNEAARRVAGALNVDYPQIAAGKALGLTPTEWAAAKAAGEPVMIGDMGAETTRALMRSAANTSPEARAELQNVIQGRFQDQSDRAGSAIRGLISGGANSAKTKAQLEAEYDAERGAAYRQAYQAGDRPIWSNRLEQLSVAPSVTDALRGAINKWRDWQVIDGVGGMNPPVKVTPDGQLKFLPGGLMPYPNIQLWDYALRNLTNAAEKAKTPLGKNTEESSRLGQLASALGDELYKQVPEFEQARGVAATYFGGNNAIQAGEKALNWKGDIGQLKLQMNKMQPAEREMFQEAYADALARKMEGTSDNSDITIKSLLNSSQGRARNAAVLGPDASGKLEAFVNRERIYDAARKALGNSTTVRQMIEAGLAGGAAGGFLSNWDPRTTMEGVLGGAGVGAGASSVLRHGVLSGTKNILGYFDRNTAAKVAQLLASDNPQDLWRGIQMASKNQRIKNSLGNIADRIYAGTGVRAISHVSPQLPSITGAQPNQQNVPGPPPQQKHGGKVKQKKKLADGGSSDDDQYSDFRPSTNVEDYRQESPLHKLETNFMLNVTGQKDNWISDLSNAITGRKSNNQPQYAKGGQVKSTKAETHYRGGTKAKRCQDCTMFRPPRGCSAVRGQISPWGLCDLFERKIAKKVAA